MSPIYALPGNDLLLAITGMQRVTWAVQIHRHHSAVAFGAAEPILRKRPLLLDAVAIHIRNDLVGGGLPIKLAAAIVRGFFDRWVEGVSHAEHHGQDVAFIVVELAGPGVNNWRCAVGPADKLDAYLGTLSKPARRVLLIRLLEVLADIRRCAVDVGIDLSDDARFFVPPDHPMLAEIKADWAMWRKAHHIGTSAFPTITERRRRAVEGLLQ